MVSPLVRTGTYGLMSCPDIRKEESRCGGLIEKTANVPDDDRLKLLFVSVQENNIDIYIQHALRSSVTS